MNILWILIFSNGIVLQIFSSINFWEYKHDLEKLYTYFLECKCEYKIQ